MSRQDAIVKSLGKKKKGSPFLHSTKEKTGHNLGCLVISRVTVLIFNCQHFLCAYWSNLSLQIFPCVFITQYMHAKHFLRKIRRFQIMVILFLHPVNIKTIVAHFRRPLYSHKATMFLASCMFTNLCIPEPKFHPHECTS